MIKLRKASIIMWVASLIAGAVAGGLMTDPETGWRLSVMVLLPASFILPLLSPELPVLCPFLILLGTPIGGSIAEQYFGARIGNLMPPFYFAWSLIWVAIGGVPGGAIGWIYRKEQKEKAQQCRPG